MNDRNLDESKRIKPCIYKRWHDYHCENNDCPRFDRPCMYIRGGCLFYANGETVPTGDKKHGVNENEEE